MDSEAVEYARKELSESTIHLGLSDLSIYIKEKYIASYIYSHSV